MAIINNRQVNTWRGNSTPPTIYHVWIRQNSDNEDESIWLYNGTEWVPFLEAQGVSIQSQDNGTVLVSFGDTFFYLAAKGKSLGLDTLTANTITISSEALVDIQTALPLKWDTLSKTLSHVTSGVIAGTYGPSADTIGTLTFNVPSVKVDEYGHVTEAKTYTIAPAAVVALNVINTSGTYPLLLSSGTPATSNTGETLKINGITITLDDSGSTLNILGLNASGNGVVAGNLTVKGKIVGDIEGNVTGTATPTNHADVSDKYGAGTSAGSDGTSAMYGHVKLQDTFETTQEGVVINPGVQTGVAASPLLVYRAMTTVKEYTDNMVGGIPAVSIEKEDNTIEKIETDYTFSKDFKKDNSNLLYINWLEI